MPEAGDPSFDAKLQAWRHKMFQIFHFLQSYVVFKITNTFSETGDKRRPDEPSRFIADFTFPEYLMTSPVR